MGTDRELFPAFIRLNGTHVVVFGGGTVALRKVKKLMKSGARIRVISPELAPEMMDLFRQKCIEWESRGYHAGDVGSAQFVIAATNHQAVNQAIWEESTALGRFINVVDNPNLCSFMFPAVTEYGKIRVAISTSGTTPKGAKQLRRALDNDLASGTNTFQSLIKHLGDSGPK